MIVMDYADMVALRRLAYSGNMHRAVGREMA